MRVYNPEVSIVDAKLEYQLVLVHLQQHTRLTKFQ